MKNLKKAVTLGFAVCSALVLFAGCQNGQRDNLETYGNKSRINAISDKESGLESLELKFAKEALECRSNEDCTMIPNTGCLGCYIQGGQHSAVNIETAEQIMKKREECQKLFSDSSKRPDFSKPSTEGTCAMDGVKCISGQCQLVTLTQQEKDERNKKIKEAFEQMQKEQGGQQGQPQQPQAPRPQKPGQGYPNQGGQFRGPMM